MVRRRYVLGRWREGQQRMRNGNAYGSLPAAWTVPLGIRKCRSATRGFAASAVILPRTFTHAYAGCELRNAEREFFSWSLGPIQSRSVPSPPD